MSLTESMLIDRLGQTLEELLAETRRTNVRLAEMSDYIVELREALVERTGSAASSVQLEQGAKEVRLTVKRYDGSPVGEIGDDAIAEFGRLFREIERQQTAGWKATVEDRAA